MKIGKKLLLSNIIITVSAMIILTIIITGVVSTYIKDNIKKDIITQNQTVSKMFLRGKNPLDLKYIESYQKLPTITYIFDTESHKLISSIKEISKLTLTKNEIDSLLAQKQEEVNKLKLWDKKCISYSETIIYQNNNLIITTIIFNDDISTILEKIIVVLIVAIAVIFVLIVIITRFSERMITNPIKTLVETTEKFAVKKFDEKAVIDTKDEFSVLANAINNMADSLKQQDIEQKRFYENISHELKTPLTVISGYAQGIKSGILQDKDKSLDIITEECDRLKKQLENVIYLSKLDTVKESFQYEKILLNKVISNALNKLDSLIILGEIDIEFYPDSEIYINADEEKLTRAFINILSNCIKYTKDTISIVVEQNDERNLIIITDNGNGFSDILLKCPFNRSVVGNKEGSGIGLSIVKKIIDGHGGEVVLCNVRQGGACYKIILPQLCHK